MLKFKSCLGIALVCGMTSAGGLATAVAQDFPNKPIRIIVPYSAGGGTDAAARVIGDHVSNTLKQTVVIENKAGASANIGTQFVARAPADGYTVLVAAPNFTTSEALFDDLGWKFEDFIPVAQFAKYSNVLVASPGSPYTDIKQVIDASKAEPGKLSFGSAGAGSNAHLSVELLNTRTGGQIQHVAYKGSGPLKTDLLGDHIQLGADGLAGLSELIRTGKVKALAVLAPERSPLAPDIPSLGDIGIRDVDASGWSGALVPAGTPPERVKILHDAFAAALNDPQVQEKFKTLGLEPASGSPEDFKSYLLQERQKWADLIKAKNIKFN